VKGLNISGLMMMGIAMIFLAVGFIMYPIVMDATDTILAWTADAALVNLPAGDITDFTGLEAIVNITPLLVLLGFVTAGAVSGFLGIKMAKGAAGGSLNPSGLMMLGLGVVFIAIALIIYPVIMDGVSIALDAALDPLSTYTGLAPILSVTPLIVLVAFIAGGVVTGFFGGKKMVGSAKAD
jgi:hypothetical protein